MAKKKKALKKYLVTLTVKSTEEIEVEAENEEDAVKVAYDAHPSDWHANCDGEVIDDKVKEIA